MALTCTLTRAQYSAIESLVYWRAALAREYETDRESVELYKLRASVECSLDECDAVRVPYWAQNTALMLGEDWRGRLGRYLRNDLRERGITTT